MNFLINSSMMRFFSMVVIIGMVSYPFLVYFGLQFLSFQSIILCLMLLFISRVLIAEFHYSNFSKPMFFVAGGGLFLCLVAYFMQDMVAIRFYPVLVSAAMLFVFVASLFTPMSIIERLARLKNPELSSNAIMYTRRVTQVWSVFFLINGSIALYTAVVADLSIWTLYNGLVSYILMGCLVIGELLVRRRIQEA